MPISIEVNNILKHNQAKQGDFVWCGDSLFLCVNSIGEFAHLESGEIEFMEPSEYTIETRQLQITLRAD